MPMITINLNAKASDKPLYIQLYESIKNDIIYKNLSPNEMLPSKRSLSVHLNVSIKTVENAYSQLLLEGYIYSVEKKGYFVNPLDDYRTSKKKKQLYVSRYSDEDYIVDLKSNKNDMNAFPISVWCRMMRETLAYDESKLLDTVPFNGIAALRISIAKYLSDFRGMEVSPDQIIIGAGTEYLYTRLIQLFGRSSIYAVEDPGYKKIREIYKSNEVSYHAIPVDNEGINIEKLSQSNASIVHVSPAHHFPLGLVMPITRRLELLQWVNSAAGRYIIEDDYDSEYRYHGIPVPPLYSIDVRGKVIYMNTFSKSIAPAVRISYMVLPETLMEKYISTMNFYSCSVSSFDQFTLAKFIDGNYLERHTYRMKRSYITKRNEIISAIRKSEINKHIQIIEDAAGTHFLIKINTALSDEELISRLKNEKILVSCLSEYCEHTYPEYYSTLIINYSGINSEQIQYFINIMEKILK